MGLEFPKHPFRTGGGVVVPHRKNTWEKESAILPMPSRVTLPMLQHIGAPCQPMVKKGDYVFAGQKIADSDAFVSAPIHASVSGTVSGIVPVTLTGGQVVDAVVIDSDGKMDYGADLQPPKDVNTRQALTKAARESGLVGLGGAGFPAHVKLNVPQDKHIEVLIVNAAECEPYVTSDHREALENGKNILDGVHRIREIYGVSRIILAVEDNKPDVIEKLREIAATYGGKSVCVLPLKSRYPQGAEKVLVQACTGIKIPVGKLPADVGCMVMNIASVSFLASYLRTGKPLTRKRVTVDGSAVKSPQNVIAPVGTQIRELIEFCGGYSTQPEKIIMGGPMMGVAVISDELPIIKQNNAILALDEKESKLIEPSSCIRCGRCMAVCPMRLMPRNLEKAVEKKDTERTLELDIKTCMECGCCAYSCPAGRRLVQAIRLGKHYLRREGK